MALHYGILRGRIDVFKREDDFSTPHLQIRVVDSHNQAWRVPVNVLSGDQSLVIFHRLDPLQNHPILAALPQVATGFTLLMPAARSATSALDYFRAPLFDWPTGVAVPHTGLGANDDLQDVLVTYLKQLRDQNGALFAFGAKFPEPGQRPDPRPIDHEFQTVQGMHDIHMNQGNASPGRFAKDNGVFQDGGLVLQFCSRYVGLFLRFATQWRQRITPLLERGCRAVAPPLPVVMSTTALSGVSALAMGARAAWVASNEAVAHDTPTGIAHSSNDQ